MATIKSHTDLSQSLTLSKILNHESADMEFMFLKKDNSMVGMVPFVKDGYEEPDCGYNIVPCWSLAALLNYLKSKNKFPEIKELSDGRFKLTTYIWDGEDCIQVSIGDTIVDACYEMVIKLHELKML